MQVAVVSDIHANLHALEAVLAAIDADPPDELWCLGDLVGYGPKPNECCALVQARAGGASPGTTTSAVRGTIDLDEFSGDAGTAARVDARGAERRLARLPRVARAARSGGRRRPLPRRRPRSGLGVRAHRRGRARDLPADRGVARARRAQPRRARGSHCGTTSSRAASRPTGPRSSSRAPAGSSTPARSASRATATRARHTSSLDLEARRASFRRVEYDIAQTQAEIREAGLPEMLGAAAAARAVKRR